MIPPALQPLATWLVANRPDITARMDHLPLQACLVILNAESGLAISQHDPIETTAPLILATLQAKHAAAHPIAVVTSVRRVERTTEPASGLGEIPLRPAAADS